MGGGSVYITVSFLGGEEQQFTIDPKRAGGKNTAWGWRYSMKGGIPTLVIRPQEGLRFEIPLNNVKLIEVNALERTGNPVVPEGSSGPIRADAGGVADVAHGVRIPRDNSDHGSQRRQAERDHGWAGIPVGHSPFADHGARSGPGRPTGLSFPGQPPGASGEISERPPLVHSGVVPVIPIYEGPDREIKYHYPSCHRAQKGGLAECNCSEISVQR